MFEAYPIGRILNRLSCDMFVIDQVSKMIIYIKTLDRKQYQLLETSLMCSEVGDG